MNQLLLATAATEPQEGAVAEASASGSIILVLLIAALVAFAVAFFVIGPGARRGEKRKGDIPLAMRPYHSDAELETVGLERAMAWGVALSVFLALFIPLYWLVEPARINDERDNFYEKEVEMGRSLYANSCASCHGTLAQGGSASLSDPAVTAPWPAPSLNNIVARYDGSTTITDIRTFIYTTIDRGRPGTPMPTWGTAFGGSMNDQEMQAITEYLLSIQTGEVEDLDAQAFVGKSGEELFSTNCARCHGVRAEGYVGPSLLNVFERYGADNDGTTDSESDTAARALVRYTLNIGRYVPTGALMPAFADTLTPEAIEEIIAYLQSIQQTDVTLAGSSPQYFGGEPGNIGALYTDQEAAQATVKDDE